MQKLSGLTHWQAVGLVNGLSKEEVIDLNESQVQALEGLREHGLTHTDLRGKNLPKIKLVKVSKKLKAPKKEKLKR